MDDNPVYLRLTRHAGWPSPREAIRVGIGLAAVASLLVIASVVGRPLIGSLLSAAPSLVVLAMGVLVVFTPPLAMMITALATGQDARKEDFNLLLISQVRSKQIVEAHIRASAYRLRLLWAIALGLALPAWLSLATIFATRLALNRCQPPYCVPVFGSWLFGLLLGLLALGAAAVVSYMIYQLAIAAGVWLGLRWLGAAPMVAGGILALYFMLPILAAVALMGLFGLEPATVGICFSVSCLLAFGTPYLNVLLSTGLRVAAEHAVEARSRAGEPPG